MLPTIRRLMGGTGKVLEIGAGTGAQSSELQAAGYDVSAVDLAASTYNAERIYPILDYDGVNLPFSDNTFDTVFSSNVMEHVEEFDGLQADIARVLKPGGHCLHVVPNQFWAFFTSVGYFLKVPGKIVRIVHRTFARIFGQRGADSVEASSESNRTVIPRFYRAHGVFCDYMIGELVEFSNSRWSARFSRGSWMVLEHGRVGLFYTGHELFGPRISFEARRTLSKILKGACNYYVLTVDGLQAKHRSAQ